MVHWRRDSVWMGFVLVLMHVSAGASSASGVVVSGNAGLLNIELGEAAPATEVVSDIARVLDVQVHGIAGDVMVSPSRLSGVNLHQALASLLPHRSFTIRYDADGITPMAITFPTASTPDGVSSSSTSPAPSPGLDTNNPAQVPVPQDNREQFINELPMLRTR